MGLSLPEPCPTPFGRFFGVELARGGGMRVELLAAPKPISFAEPDGLARPKPAMY